MVPGPPEGMAFENWPPLAIGDSATLTPGCLQGQWSPFKRVERLPSSLSYTPETCSLELPCMENLLHNATSQGQRRPIQSPLKTVTVQLVHPVHLGPPLCTGHQPPFSLTPLPSVLTVPLTGHSPSRPSLSSSGVSSDVVLGSLCSHPLSSTSSPRHWHLTALFPLFHTLVYLFAYLLFILGLSTHAP